MIWLYIAEMLLYLCFSLLIGSLLIHLVPANKKPDLVINKRVLQISILGIAFLSTAPVIRLVVFLYEDIGLLLTVQNVVGEFEVGQAWSVTVLTSLFFYFFVSVTPVFKSKVLIVVSLVFTFLLLLAFGLGSHAASLTDGSGFIFHTLHFTAATVWIGILLIVSWFSVSSKNWLPFIKWFTPLAIICLIIISASGLYIMTLALNLKDYTDAWQMPYGQAILVKHLLILPVLLFAFINGVFIRAKLSRGKKVNPLPWARAESVVLLLVLSATAVLGQQEPPHSIESFIRMNGASNLFAYFHTGSMDTAMHLQFEWSILGVLFLFLGTAFGSLVIYSFKQKIPVYLTLVMGLFCVLSFYVGLMLSVG